MTSLYAIDEVLVAANVKDCVDVLNADLARSVLVHEAKGLVDHVLPPLGEGFAEPAHEFLERDVTISINVIELHESLHFDDFREDAESV